MVETVITLLLVVFVYPRLKHLFPRFEFLAKRTFCEHQIRHTTPQRPKENIHTQQLRSFLELLMIFVNYFIARPN